MRRRKKKEGRREKEESHSGRAVVVQATDSGWLCVEPDYVENSRQIHDVENQRVCLCIGWKDEGKGRNEDGSSLLWPFRLISAEAMLKASQRKLRKLR